MYLNEELYRTCISCDNNNNCRDDVENNRGKFTQISAGYNYACGILASNKIRFYATMVRKTSIVSWHKSVCYCEQGIYDMISS